MPWPMEHGTLEGFILAIYFGSGSPLQVVTPS
jgi:hypothetical protein